MLFISYICSMEMSIEITSRNKIKSNIGYKEVFITWLPNEDKSKIIDKLSELFDLGYDPIPHIPAKKIKDREEAYQLSDEFSKYSTKVLIIGGGGKQEGDFSTVKELVDTKAFNNFKIGVGGFPEGNGRLSYDDSMKILKEKTYADFVVTQWSLNKKSIDKFLNDSPIPVYLGLPNKCSTKQLITFAKVCGISNSVKGIISNPLNIMRFLFGFDPKYLVNKYKRHDNLKKIHVYSFGNYDKL